RLGGARWGACRFHVTAEPVVAEGALPGPAVLLAAVDGPEGAGRDAVAAAVAHVRLDHHGAELGAHQCAGWADVEASRLRTVLADVARHQPAQVPMRAVVLPHRPGLLDEGDVAPGVGADAPGVVVGLPGPV